MQVIIGGAYNGKRRFVEQQLKQPEKWKWLGANELDDLLQEQHPFLIIEDVHLWIAQTNRTEEEIMTHLDQGVQKKEVIFIFTDMGRGIVPMEAEQRQLRDICGRVYQHFVREADEVIRVWYGLAQILKKRGEQ